MKICVTSEGNSLDSKVDSRFGRCRYFILYDTETGNFDPHENSNAQFSGGAGIQSAQLVASKGVKAVLTGNVGPNAFQTLKAAGIEIYTNASGKVRDAVGSFMSGNLKTTDGPSVNDKHGMEGRI